jgi:tetratricopeptide (TPR) repeat protein
MLMVTLFAPAVPVRAASVIERAQAAVDEASRHYTAGEYEQALGALRRAESLAERAEDPALPSIRFNIARCLEKLERWEDALQAYESYNELPDAAHRKRRAFRAVQALEPKVFATVSVACDPVGSVVEIEGLTQGTPSCPWRGTRVRPGSYAVRVSHPGYVAVTEFIDVEPGEPFTLQVSLERDPQAVASGALAGGAPRRFRPAPWLAAGGSLLAFSAAIGFGVTAVDQRDEAETLLDSAERDDLVNAFETNRALTYVFIGLGTALAGTSAVLFLTQQSRRGRPDSGGVGPVSLSPSGLQVKF